LQNYRNVQYNSWGIILFSYLGAYTDVKLCIVLPYVLFMVLRPQKKLMKCPKSNRW